MYELFERLVKMKDRNEDDLTNELFTIVSNEKLVKYLVTFKKDICECLEQSKFFEKSIDGLVEEPEKKKVREKEKTNKWIPKEEELGEVNFLKMTNQEMTMKIPTLKRTDHAEYIQFRLEPPIQVREKMTKFVNVKEQIDRMFRDCFESENLNEIQSIVFEQAYKGIDNMLVCAPTGAGKTNIATLTMLNAMNKVENILDVRIAYISPMKALAS
jgi:antiviral helicase SLH1